MKNEHLNLNNGRSGDILSSYYAKCHFDVFIKTYHLIVGGEKGKQ